MARMTKAQAKRRLMEAQSKFKKVYMAGDRLSSGAFRFPVKTADMEAIEKIVDRCIKRLG